MTVTSAEHTLVLNSAGPFREFDAPDGAVTLTGTGNYIYLFTPDALLPGLSEPGLFNGHGQWIDSFAADGTETWTFHGTFVDLCPLVA